MREVCLQQSAIPWSRWIPVLAAGILLFVAIACSDGADGGGPPPPPANTWDQMRWDEGEWALQRPTDAPTRPVCV